MTNRHRARFMFEAPLDQAIAVAESWSVEERRAVLRTMRLMSLGWTLLALFPTIVSVPLGLAIGSGLAYLLGGIR